MRLNSEVKAVFECKPRRAISAGEGITEKDIEEITNIFLTSEDEDAGHITVIFVNGHAHLAFDFQYNTRRIKELLEVAREFIDTAGLALNAGNQRAFVENQFRKIQKSESCMGLGKGGG
ncbi:MAG TPA: hypothetical protein VI895_01975 [Bdellovibrionota bacterium]|nr:hypothetical protein [Bdellovibrionota bacterium]